MSAASQPSTRARPTVSVVVPAYNAEATLDRCLSAIGDSLAVGDECIVVDACSTDDTRAVAAGHKATLLRLEQRHGPAGARNRGAREANGDVLFFVDSDVQLRNDTLERIARHFEDSGTDAVFGSYDDAPSDPGLVSRYKNLFHHFIHQTSEREANTFWGGCGAIRRSVFLEVGGFDERYTEPSIEDIELGYRLRDAGHSIVLDRDVQAKHLKRWTLVSLVLTDIRCRGIPWCRLWQRRGEMPKDLNTRGHHRISTILEYLAVLSLLLAAGVGVLGWRQAALGGFLLALVFLATAVSLNFDLYRFFARNSGVWFAIRAIPLHLAYYLYSGACLIWVLMTPGAVRSARR